MLKNKISNILTVILVSLVLFKGFEYFKLQKQQGNVAPVGNVIDLNSNPISLSFKKKQALVFWATWCGPCSVELGRINAMIKKGQITSDSILAISIKEDPNLVASFVAENKYLFPVVVDFHGQLAMDYQVRGTPTIYLIDESQKISWVSVGISPSLEFRLSRFFEN